MTPAVLLAMSLATCLQDQVANPATSTAAPQAAPSPAAPPAAPVAPPTNQPTPPTPAPAAPSTNPSTAPYDAFPTSGVAAPLSAPSPANGAAAPGATAPYVVFTTPPGTVFPSFTPPPAPPGRFVFAFLPGLTIGVSARPTPSADVSFFFGGRLRNNKWALGYQFTGSVGMAERYWLGILTHRHHITALTKFGRRGFATIGGGVAIFVLWPAVAELETRVGIRFGPRERGVFGGQLRLGYNFYYREKAPLPQLGLFLGISLF